MNKELKKKIKEKLKSRSILLTGVLVGLAFFQVIIAILQVVIMLIKLK